MTENGAVIPTPDENGAVSDVERQAYFDNIFLLVHCAIANGATSGVFCVVLLTTSVVKVTSSSLDSLGGF